MTKPLHVLLLAPALSMTALAQSDAQRLASACNQFAADLHGQLAASAQPTCSPGSISIALLMLLPAARGATADELATVLHLPEDLRGDRMHKAARDLLGAVGLLPTVSPHGDREAPPLVITNDLWVQTGYDLVPSYVELLRRSFAATQRHADFRADAEAARTTINDYIQDATNDRIRDLLPPGLITPLTRVVLTNALWFKAGWEHPFSKRGTEPLPFTLAGGESVKVPTMRQVQFFGYAEQDGWQVLTMPFRGTTIECEIVLPREGAALADAERALLTRAYGATVQHERVHVELPRFTVQAAHGLQTALKALGMRTAFDARGADFSGMDPKNDLVVADVVHQTWIAVDEEGAEAAAATAVVLKERGAVRPSEPKQFQANRPFAFGLRDRETGLLLFVGRVSDPRLQQG